MGLETEFRGGEYVCDSEGIYVWMHQEGDDTAATMGLVPDPGMVWVRATEGGQPFVQRPLDGLKPSRPWQVGDWVRYRQDGRVAGLLFRKGLMAQVSEIDPQTTDRVHQVGRMMFLKVGALPDGIELLLPMHQSHLYIELMPPITVASYRMSPP